jgi:hypothetical protein
LAQLLQKSFAVPISLFRGQLLETELTSYAMTDLSSYDFPELT